jgi:predicted RNA binding protein YcfA (HicA-like mRNA interferase family)
MRRPTTTESETHVVLFTAGFFGRGFDSRRLHQISYEDPRHRTQGRRRRVLGRSTVHTRLCHTRRDDGRASHKLTRSHRRVSLGSGRESVDACRRSGDRTSTVKALSGKELARLLESQGWSLQRINGSHHIYAKLGNTVRISVPIHGNESLKMGLSTPPYEIGGAPSVGEALDRTDPPRAP